jgi:hypothetical protein
LLCRKNLSDGTILKHRVRPLGANGCALFCKPLIEFFQRIEAGPGCEQSLTDTFHLSLDLSLLPAGTRWLRTKEEITPSQNFKAILSLSLKEIILKALFHDLKQRYQWVEDLWEDLDKAGRKFNTETEQ